MSAKTLYDKIWDDHYVTDRDDGSSLMYIDRHLIHEVTSPQAFEGLRENNLKPRRASSILATPDHNVPTTLRESDIDGIEDPISKLQVVTLDQNCNEFGINQFKLNDLRQGIVHVIGPEQGLTLPGMTIVCGDSHTSTHGAFGSLAMGIGTSEVEHVLATQCLVTQKQKNMMISVNGKIQPGVTAKDITMFIIGQIGTAGGTGHVIEYAGEAITSLSMEGRMTLCNMAIEAGARAGMVSPDQITFDYVKSKSVSNNLTQAMNYMGLTPGTRIKDIELDQIFIGSCTNSRIEDLREAAKILKDNKISKRIKRAIVVPGSGLVKKQAEIEGLDEIFLDAGFEWRDAGCSMCLGMNPDQLNKLERCASTSNRNFEGRQGYKGRTHLVSPTMAALASLEGKFSDIRKV